MEYITKAKQEGNDFFIPIYIDNKIEIPQKNSGYYTIVFFTDGILSLTEKENSSSNKITNFPSPGILCINSNHNIIKSSFELQNNDTEDKKLFCLILKPNGLNSNFVELPETFEYNALTSIKDSYNYSILNKSIADKLRQLFSEIDTELNEVQGAHWPCLTRSYILEILLLIGRLEYQDRPSTFFSIPTGDEKTQSIFQYIHTYYHQEITLDLLAAKFSTNRTSLNKMFNQTCGTSAMSYLSQIRLEMATLLLRNTELAVATISERAGFSDEAYFSRLFKQKLGKTPSDYRKSIPNPYGA